MNESMDKEGKTDEDMLYKIYFSHNEIQQTVFEQEKDAFSDLHHLKA